MSEEISAKLDRYRRLTNEALAKAGVIDASRGGELLEMASNYYNDALHFEKEGKPLTALAAYSYAHAWIDAGVRLGFLDGKNDDRLFVLPRKANNK